MLGDVDLSIYASNPVVLTTIAFSLLAIEYCELLHQQKQFVIGRQLLKSATAIGANVFEAQASESRADFIHKMKIAYKEAEETTYWLLLCSRSAKLPGCDGLTEKRMTIKGVLGKIIATAKNS